MAKNPQRKRDRRKKKQAKRLRRNRETAARRSVADRFPKFHYDQGDAPDALMEAAVRASSKIRAEHTRLLPPPVVALLRRARKDGFRRAFPLGRQSQAFTLMKLALGECVFRQLPERIVDSLFPFNDVEVIPGRPNDESIQVRLRSLKERKTEFGTVYYSPLKPTVELNGERKQIAFSTHAIRQICERTVLDWRTFSGLGDAFGFFYNCVYFEIVELPGGQTAFTLFNRCDPGFFVRAFVSEVLGEDDGGKYFYRIGYCPAVVNDDLLVAKTLLVPGMDGTPEQRLLLRPGMSTVERMEIQKRASKLTFKGLVEDQDFSLLKECHDRGIPQVVSLEGVEVFKYLRAYSS
jgi:hypothetical protein